MATKGLPRSPSSSPPPLFKKNIPRVVFPDRETYLMTLVSYLMGLIKGTPNNKFVSGPMRPKVVRVLDILWEERLFIMHTQRSLQIRKGTIIVRITVGERRLTGFTETVSYLNDIFHPADNYYILTTTLISCSSSVASNGTPLCPMPGAYIPTMVNGRNNEVYQFIHPSPTFHTHLMFFGQRSPSART